MLDVADRVTRWIETEEGERYLLLDNYIKNLNTLNRYMDEDINEETRAYYQQQSDSIKRKFVKLATQKPTEESVKDAS